MPRFYFHVRDDVNNAFLPDASGVELPDLQSARAEGLESARELIIEAIRTKKCIDGCHICIVDGAGDMVLRLSFDDAVKLVPKKPPGDA